MFLSSVMLHLRWLFLSPAVCHELFKLELSWAWEPPASSRAFRIGESKRPIFLMEMKKKKSYLERLRYRLKFDNLFIMPRKNFEWWFSSAIDERS